MMPGRPVSSVYLKRSTCLGALAALLLCPARGLAAPASQPASQPAQSSSRPTAMPGAPQPSAPKKIEAQPGKPGAAALLAELERRLELNGYFRTRFDLMDNFDLNRGPTPSTGQLIFPSSGGVLSSGNMRLRLEPTIRIGWGVAIHAQIDMLDNIVFGSTPAGLPASAQTPVSAGSTQMAVPQAGTNAGVDSIQVKRAWGEVVLPVAVLSAGRMGALIDWGTGFFINSGSCIDCDSGDVGDRISLLLPLFDHLLGFAFDFGASGPTSATIRPDDLQPFNLDRRDDVRSYALLLARYDTPDVAERYRAAGRTVLQYGLVAALRTQQYDLPGYYLTGDLNRSYGPSDLVKRDLLAFAGDLWLGLRHGGFSLDLEAALVASRTENASLMPGVELRDRITALQWGGVMRAQYQHRQLLFEAEVGLASGDAAPGFGVRPPLGQLQGQPGDLDAPQLRLPGDTSVNNLRFNPDYHIDLILWRSIIGTVTDAFYLRPRVAWQPLQGLWLEGAAVTSGAMAARSTPSSERMLGVELDLQLRYRVELGFEARLGYGVLFPLGGFKNVALGLDPEPAHALHAVLAYIIP